MNNEKQMTVSSAIIYLLMKPISHLEVFITGELVTFVIKKIQAPSEKHTLPFELPAYFNNSYLYFLSIRICISFKIPLFNELEELPLQQRRVCKGAPCGCMQSSTPPHFSLVMRNYLNNHFPPLMERARKLVLIAYFDSRF